MAVEAPTGRVLWTKEDPVFFPVEYVRVAPTGRLIVASPAEQGEKRGIAMLHEATGEIADFIPGVPCRGAFPIPASGPHPAGSLALLGRRDVKRIDLGDLGTPWALPW